MLASVKSLLSLVSLSRALISTANRFFKQRYWALIYRTFLLYDDSNALFDKQATGSRSHEEGCEREIKGMDPLHRREIVAKPLPRGGGLDTHFQSFFSSSRTHQPPKYRRFLSDRADLRDLSYDPLLSAKFGLSYKFILFSQWTRNGEVKSWKICGRL